MLLEKNRLCYGSVCYFFCSPVTKMDVRESTSFWTSTTAGTLYYSDAIHLNNRDRKASLVTPDRRNGFSIRCLMD